MSARLRKINTGFLPITDDLFSIKKIIKIIILAKEGAIYKNNREFFKGIGLGARVIGLGKKGKKHPGANLKNKNQRFDFLK